MKRPTVALTVLTLVLLAAPQTAAAQSRPIAPCTAGLAGTWLGQTGPISMLVTYANVFATATGTSDLDLYGDPTLGGAFQTAVRITSGRGVWSMTNGPNLWYPTRPFTYDYTFVVIGLAADSTVVYQLKVSGEKTIARDCRTMTFTVNMDIFAPGQDLLGDEPPAYGSMPFAPGTAKRMLP